MISRNWIHSQVSFGHERCLPCAVCAIAVLLLAPAVTRAEVNEAVVFRSGEDGYDTYRIPAIVQAANGNLLAFAEGRKNSSADHGDIDIVLKHSADNGRTWSDMQLVQDEWTSPTASITIGNPAPVVDQLDPNHPGRIWLPFTRNNDRVLVTYSDDHGASWSERREITATAKDSSWGWYATGPVHGIQLQRGAHRGRLIIPSDHRDTASNGWGAHILYSDDHGATWQIGAVDTRQPSDSLHPNECVAVELVDGRLYVNARDQNGSDPARRAVAYSSDGGSTFARPFAPEPEITTPVVQNSAIRFAATDQGAERNVLVYSAPGHATQRRDLTILVSFDEGKTWTLDTVLDPGPAAYSDLVKIDDDTIGVLYEAGDSLYDEILFASFGLGDLTAEPWNGIHGDVDQNGLLNRADLDAFVRLWKPGSVTYYGGRDSYVHGDLDFNGVHNLADAALLRSAFVARGISVAALDRWAAVPEPSSLILAITVSAVHWARFLGLGG